MIALWVALAWAEPAAADASPEVEVATPAVLEPDWGVAVRAPLIPRIWVPVEDTDSLRPAEPGDRGALPATSGGRELPSPWARRGRHMTADGSVAKTTPTRVDPHTGEILVRQRPALGVRVLVASVGVAAVWVAGAGLVAAGASGL